MKDLVINFDKGIEKQALYSTLKDLKGEYVIKLKKKSKGRSLQENKYYWGVVLAYISNYTGHNTLTIHEFLKHEFIPYVKFEDDYRLTTTDLTHDQIWEYIDKIRHWAKDFLNLDVPDPDGVIL